MNARPQDPKTHYEFLGQLSHNSADSSDIVYSVLHRASGQRYACKRISKHQASYSDYGCSSMRCAPQLLHIGCALSHTPAEAAPD